MPILEEHVPPALGYVRSDRTGNRNTVEVHFFNIPGNPPEVRGKVRRFYVDLNPAQYILNRPIVARWDIPRTTVDGDLQVDNARVFLRPLEEGLGMFPAETRRQWAREIVGAEGSIPGIKLTIQQILAARTDGTTDEQKVINEDAIPETLFEDTFLATPVPLPGAGEELLMPSSYCRIGYVSFTVDSPVENITILNTTTLDQKQTLRSRSPILKGTQYQQQQVTLTMTFAGRRAMNQVLLPLLRQFRRVPFQPVINRLLNDSDIHALTLASVQVGTVPGFPEMLKVVLSGFAFNFAAYFPSAPDLDTLFCYPLLKLWVEKSIADREVQLQPSFVPFSGPWNGRFTLRSLDEAWLQQSNEFPEKAEAARLHNQNVDAAKLARTSRNTSGFIVDGFQDVRDAQGKYGTKKALPVVRLQARGTVAIDDNSHAYDYVFIRVFTKEAAELLARDPELAVVAKGEVLLQQYSATADSYKYASAPRPPMPGEIKETSWHITSAKVSTRDFRTLLARNDAVVLEGLKNGYYAFVLPAQASSLTQLANDKRQEVPKPNQEPVWSEANAFDAEGLDMTIDGLTASMENLVAPLQIRSDGSPTHQYMGSTALFYKISGILPESAVPAVTQFLQRVDDLARRFPGRIGGNGSTFGGFVEIENELAQFLGTTHVLPLTFSTSTVDNFPGQIRFELVCVEFERTQRNRERLRDLNADIKQTPISTAADGTQIDESRESLNDSMKQRFYRNREFHRRLARTEVYPDLALPTYGQLRKWVRDIKNDDIWDWEKNQPKVHGKDPDRDYSYLDPAAGGTGWQWVAKFRRTLPAGAVQLPWRMRLLNVPGDEPRNKQRQKDLDGRFADPDFYCSPSQDWGATFVDRIVGAHMNPTPGWQQNSAHQYQLVDGYGTVLQMGPGMDGLASFLDDKQLKSDPQRTREVGSQALRDGKIQPVGSGTFPNSQAELSQNSPYGTGSQYPGHYGQYGPTVDGSDAVLTSPGKGGFSRKAVDDLRHQPWWGAVDALWRRVGISTFGWEHNVLRESGGRVAAQQAGGAGRGLYQFDFDSGVGARLVQEVGRPRALQIANDPLLATEYFIKAERGAIGRVVSGSGGDPYKQAVLFARYVERPAERHWRKVEQDLSPYYGTGGARTPEERQSGLDIQVEQAYGELLTKFQLGYGFKGNVLAMWQEDGSGRPSKYIKTEWLQAITNTVVSVSASGPYQSVQSENSGYYWVAVPHLRTFALEWVKAGKNPPLEKLPSESVGLSTYAPNTQYLAEMKEQLNRPPSLQDVWYKPYTGNDIFHDSRRSMICGRLLNAFPTFYIAIVDGGRPLRVWRLYDHVYGMMSVTQIAVHRTRKTPVETAVVSFSNMYGHLTAQVQELDRQPQQDNRQGFTNPDSSFNVEVMARWASSWVRIDDETLAMWNQHLNSLMLKAGTRLHIRMGYGSDANELPIVFNGVVTEVPVDEGEVQVVALSDGVELTNDMPPNDSIGNLLTYQKTSWFGGGMNPRELMMEILDPARHWWSKIVDGSKNALGENVHPFFYYDKINRSPYGIEHFGKPIWSGVSRYDAEQGVNVYNPEHSNPLNDSWVWDSALRLLQVPKWGKNDKLIGVMVQEATPWKIFETCRKSVPDYILYPHPFELRSTLFYGKPWFPLYYAYRDELIEGAQVDTVGNASADDWRQPGRFMKWKPFQQFHLISSTWNLVENRVRADATEVFTRCQAVGTYNGFLPGKDLSPEASHLWQVDEDIFDEFQRTRTVECGLYTTPGMKLDDTLASPLQVFMARNVVNIFAQMELSDGIRDMYQGPLVILGNGFIKPWDMLGVNDELSRMNGMCTAKEVTHTMSLQTGFVTQVVPDCMNSMVDFEGRDLYLWLTMLNPHFTTALATTKMIGTFNKQLHARVAHGALRRVEEYLKGAIPKTADNGLRLEMRTQLGELQRRIGQVKNKQPEIYKLLDELLEDPKWQKVLDKMPLSAKAEVRLNRDLRALAATAGPKAQATAGNLQKSATDWALRRYQDLASAQTKSAQELAKVESEWGRLTKEQQRAAARLAKEIDGGLDVRGIDANAQKLAVLFEDLKDARRAAKGARTSVQAFRRVAVLGKEAQVFLRGAVSKALSYNILTFAVMILTGSLCEMFLRWAHTRQCLTIFPLKIGQREFTAGINGHRGAVIGDPLGVTDQFLQFWADSVRGAPDGVLLGLNFLPFVGDIVNVLAQLDYRAPQLPDAGRGLPSGDLQLPDPGKDP